jgi:hypothetical protein
MFNPVESPEVHEIQSNVKIIDHARIDSEIDTKVEAAEKAVKF